MILPPQNLYRNLMSMNVGKQPYTLAVQTPSGIVKQGFGKANGGTFKKRLSKEEKKRLNALIVKEMVMKLMSASNFMVSRNGIRNSKRAKVKLEQILLNLMVFLTIKKVEDREILHRILARSYRVSLPSIWRVFCTRNLLHQIPKVMPIWFKITQGNILLLMGIMPSV